MKYADIAQIKFTDIAGSRSYLPFCENCPLWPAFHPVPGAGNPKADVMFIGQEPGEEEDATGFPFVGPAGERLSTVIEELGFKRRDVYLSNLVHCRLPKDSKKHQKQVVNHCGGNWLYNEIADLSPKHIICVGKDALRWIEEEMGLFWPFEATIHSIPHTAAALRHPIDEARLRCKTDDLKEELHGY